MDVDMCSCAYEWLVGAQRCDLTCFIPAPCVHMIRTQCTNTVMNSLFLDICSARTPTRVLPASTAPTAWTTSETARVSPAPLAASRHLLARRIARPVLRGQPLPRGARHSVPAWQAPRARQGMVVLVGATIVITQAATTVATRHTAATGCA